MSIYDKASLVLIPSGTKTSKVYSQKPVNGDGDFTFSRSTAATRVNASGNIEKETQNLAKYSNDFSNSVWYKYTNTTYTLTTETITDPFGVSTSVYKVTLTGSGYVTLRQEFSGDTRYMTASAYIKKSSSSLNVALDQSDGNVANSASNTDWQRLSSSHASGYSFSFFDITITGVSGDYFYVSSAQMELGGAARDYIETTTAAVEGGITDNVPRLDYTDSSCPALLLEPQRTNLLENSEYILGGDWNALGGALTIEQNTTETLSPEGKYNAGKITLSTATNRYFSSQGYTLGGLTDISGSVWLKSDGADISGQINFFNGAGVKSITITNEWQRFELNRTATNSTEYFGLDFRSGSTSGAVYCYGWQLENNSSYATSYIPTYGTSVTRVADNTRGASSSIFNDNASSLFLDLPTTSQETNIKEITISDGTTSNRLNVYSVTSNHLRTSLVSGGSVILNTAIIDVLTNQHLKILITYTGNTYKVFVNGVIKLNTNMSDNPIGLDRLDFANSSGTASLWYGEINKAIYFPTSLTDQEAIDLTTI